MADSQTVIDIKTVKTRSGKMVDDFVVPETLYENDTELIKLILESEAMDDGEKQYWFNLTKVMNEQQKEKLYDILRRERKKLNEIRGKQKQIDPVEAKRKADEQARMRAQKQEAVAKKEKTYEEKEKVSEDELLDGVEGWS